MLSKIIIRSIDLVYGNILGVFTLSYITLCFFITTNTFSQSLSAEQIYKKVSDAVVVIHTYDANNKLAKQGSGVVISDKGYIVTNYHVLEGCERLEVLHNKKVVPYVDIIGIDVEKDILILKIDSKKFTSINIGDIQKISVGQKIYAIGSPLGFENTISEGIISGLRNEATTGRSFIQISASISPGSSGGAVVNDRGELIGISTLSATAGQNLNFSIPINDVLSVKISSYSKNESYKYFELFSKGYNAIEEFDYQNAIKYFTRYLEKYPNEESALNNRGIAKLKLEEYVEAIQDFDRALELNPSYSPAYHNRGSVKNSSNDFVGAIKDYDRAIEIDPGYAEAYNNRGNAKNNLKDYVNALKDFTRAIEINPSYAIAYFNRGITKKEMEDNRGAIQDYTKAFEINPNDIQVLNNRGALKAKLGDYRGAIQDYNKAIVINPNEAFAYYNRGIAKYNLGDQAGACLDWSKAGELGTFQVYDVIKQYCK